MKTMAALMLALSSAVFAQTAATDASEPAFDALPLQTQNGVRFLNGGADLDQMAAMKANSRGFNLQYLFSGRGGQYAVADSVTLFEGRHEVVTIDDVGPLLMLDVPPGRYTLEARFGRIVDSRPVTVGQGTTRVNWNEPKLAD